MKAPKDYQRVHKPFRFRLGTDTHELPTDLSAEAMAGLADAEGGTPSQMIAALRDLVPGDVMDVIVKMPILDFRELLSDWMDVLSGGESGNSDGSSTS